MRHYVQWTTVFINKKTKLNCSFYFLASDRGWNEALMRIFLYIFEKRWFKVEQWEDHLIQKIRSKGCTCRKKMTRVMRFRPTGPIWGLQRESVRLYGGWLYFECNSFWYIHVLYKLIELCLRVAASSDGFLQILQPRFGSSEAIRNWENIVVYFPVIASADNQLWMKNSKVPYLKDG